MAKASKNKKDPFKKGAETKGGEAPNKKEFGPKKTPKGKKG